MSWRNDELRVHLDHLIKRQSIRYISPQSIDSTESKRNFQENDWSTPDGGGGGLRYTDISDDSWFRKIRKPDFQRETNAWKPDDCLAFIDSVVSGRIIPSIILWHNKENELIYVLDGAHRLSVLRAWMIDDWGDKAEKYYERRDQDFIRQSADVTRKLINTHIGLFSDFEEANREFVDLSDQEKVVKQVMGNRYSKAIFYQRAFVGRKGLSSQWEHGNYESAEQSFLRINRSGQSLDPWEATLIEYRRSSYARCIMSIANGGENGYYWPEPSEIGDSEELKKMVSSFSSKAAEIYRKFFVPPYKLPITSLNVPMMVAPEYFQKHKFLLQIVPLVTNGQIAITEDQQIAIMKKDYNSSPEIIIQNGQEMLNKLAAGLEHLISPTDSSTSLSIVPLVYWYNQKAQNIRGLFYGFLYWLLSGTDQDITNRKLIFSANRDRFEYVLIEFKSEISELQDKSGAGLKVANSAANVFQDLLLLLHENRTWSVDSEILQSSVLDMLKKYIRISPRNQKRKISRNFSKSDKSQINLRKLYEHTVSCHICGGIINLQQGGIQHDHIEDYAFTHVTDPNNGGPTHSFCNRYKHEISEYRNNLREINLPAFGHPKEKGAIQLSYWGNEIS